MSDTKELVRRPVEEGGNRRSEEVLEQVADGAFAEVARRWVSGHLTSLPRHLNAAQR
jgi:hypothetical protein